MSVSGDFLNLSSRVPSEGAPPEAPSIEPLQRQKEGFRFGASLCEGFHEGDFEGRAPLLGNPKDKVFERYSKCSVNGPLSP